MRHKFVSACLLLLEPRRSIFGEPFVLLCLRAWDLGETQASVLLYGAVVEFLQNSVGRLVRAAPNDSAHAACKHSG